MPENWRGIWVEIRFQVYNGLIVGGSAAMVLLLGKGGIALPPTDRWLLVLLLCLFIVPAGVTLLQRGPLYLPAAEVGLLRALGAGHWQVLDGAAPGSASVLRSAADAPAGTQLRIRVSDGALGAVSSGREDGAS